MIWKPLNLTTACPAATHVTACSHFGFVYLNLLVQLYGGPIEKGVDRDLRYDDSFNSQNKHTYDFIVIGAGAAGCVVANRLTENPKWKVLLLEAGPEQPQVTLSPALSLAILGSSIDWQFSTEPNGKSCLARPGGRCDVPSGRTMGGTTSINGMLYVRGNKADFDGWASRGNEGWSYKDVLPFFKKSEKNLNIEGLNRKYHGVDGNLPVSRYPYTDWPSIMITEAFNERGLPLSDCNAEVQEGTMQGQTMSQNGERVSSNSAFIHPIRKKRKNLTIKTESEVVKILINEQRKAYGVIYNHRGEFYIEYANNEIILSAGTINSPKLLMLSGIGPKQHLESLNIGVIKNLPVGKNLHDQVTFNGVLIALPNETATTVDKEELLEQVYEYGKMALKDGPMSRNGPTTSTAFLKTELDLPTPDIQIHINHVNNWREFLREPILYEKLSIFPTAFYDGLLPIIENLVPRSRGFIHLNSTAPYGPPILYPNYFGDDKDLLPLLRAVRFVLTLEGTTAFKSNGAYFVREPLPACKHWEWGTDEYYICLARSYTRPTYHLVGTCKMGPKWDTTAVVDNKLRVYGIHGLRVIDASIMPVVTRGNTNAPTVMIGERGVDFVIRYWKHLENN